MLNKIKSNYEFVLLTLIAFSVRLIHLSKFNLWLDEGAAAEDVHKGLVFILKDSFKAEPNPPFYNVFLIFWTKLFGDSEFALRLPSAFFGALCVGFIYLIGKKYSSKIVGFLAGLLVLGNPFYLYYSQESRVYALYALISLFFIYYFPYELEWKNKKKFVIASLVLPWVHVYGVFLLLAGNAFVFVKYLTSAFDEHKKFFIKSWLKIQVITIGLASIWYINFLCNHTKYFRRVRWIESKSLIEIYSWVKSYVSSYDQLSILVIVLSLSIYLYLLIKQKGLKNKVLQLSSIWLLFTFLFPILAEKFWPPFLEKRYTIAASMLVPVFIFVSFEGLLERFKKFSYFLVGALIVLSLLQTREYFQYNKKQEWVEILEAVKKLKKAQDVVVLDSSYERSSFDYYLRKRGEDEVIKPIYVQEPAELQDLVKKYGYVWFIRTGVLNPEGVSKDQFNIEENFSSNTNQLQLIKISIRESL